MKVLSASLVLIVVLASGISPASAQYKWETRKSMAFYVAKGTVGSCGDGCTEWIAAEGWIGPNSAAQLQAILSRLGKEKLPIIFNSLGGLRSESIKIGRLLRERGLTAGVGKTVVEGCDPFAKADDAKCSSLKQSGKKVPAELTTFLAECSSACFTAFLGSRNRWVAPGSHLSIHAGQPTFRKGNQVSETGKIDKKIVAENERLLRQYFREMGFKESIVDAAQKVPHEKGHYLTRDEIISYGVDTRPSPETPWMLVRSSPERSRVAKFIVEPTGPTKEFPTSLLEFSCSSGNLLSLNYFRGLSSGRQRTPQIEFVAGDHRAKAHFREETAGLVWIENQRAFERYTAFPDQDFVQSARKSGVELIEIQVSSPQDKHVVKLSPAGLEAAFDKFKC